MHSKDFKQRDAQTIEADAHHRHTAQHLLLKTILIVSTLVVMLGMHTAQAVGSVPKLNYNYAAATSYCQGYGNPASPQYYPMPAGAVWRLANDAFHPYISTAGRGAYANNCIVNWCSANGSCADQASGNPPSQPVCPANTFLNYPYAGAYSPAALASIQCACTTGYAPDASRTRCVVSCIAPLVPDAAGTACVAPPLPPVVPTCPIADLPAITDPEAQLFENNPNRSDTTQLTVAMQTALTNLTNAASAAGGAPTVGSAFRPPLYNQHLIDVWNKREEFLDAVDDPNVMSNSNCLLVLWPKIKEHFQRHGLLITQPPVPNSRHTKGLAFDMTINLPAANIDALAVGAGLRRPLPVSDPVHFQFP